MIKWEFPSTNWGIESGKNDPGLETFRGNPYDSIAREPIQNSIDARVGSKPVRVEFSVFKIKTQLFPGYKEYLEILKKCLAEATENSDTYKEIKKAYDVLNQEFMYFMKISDYNTYGLKGSKEIRKTPWHSLIKSVGESEKDATSGGAFGIGKYASFVVSLAKAVFYSTLDEDGNYAFQGVSKLISYMDDDDVKQATGFYGVAKKIQPITNKEEISIYKENDYFNRTEVGTDLFIAGFDYKKDWNIEVQMAVVRSFFPAIHAGDLEVIIDGELIDSTNLGDYVQKIKEKYPTVKKKLRTVDYYEVLTSPDSYHFIEENFKGLGRIDLYIQIKNTYTKVTAMARKSGMIIQEKQTRNSNKYAAVLLISGEKFNKELKDIENPAHNAWEPARKKDSNMRETLDDLYIWINEKINDISPLKDVDTIEVDELASFLPDENELENGLSDSEEGILLEAKISKKTPKKTKNKQVVLSVTNDVENGSTKSGHPETDSFREDEYENHENKKEHSKKPTRDEVGRRNKPDNGGNMDIGVATEGGGYQGEHDKKPTRDEVDRRNKPGNGGNTDIGVATEGGGYQGEHNKKSFRDELGSRNKDHTRNKQVTINSYKVFCTNVESGDYRLNINAANSGSISIILNVIGSEFDEKAEIEKAFIDNQKVKIAANKVGPFKLKKGKNRLDFTLKNNMRVALGVEFSGK